MIRHAAFSSSKAIQRDIDQWMPDGFLNLAHANGETASMGTFRSFLAVVLVIVLVGKSIAGAAFPLLGMPGHHAPASAQAHATAALSVKEQPQPEHSPPDSNSTHSDLRHHAGPHVHTCPQVSMAAAVAPALAWPKEGPSQGAIVAACAPPASRTVTPLLHPPRTGARTA
jgi:hypothetical protein